MAARAATESTVVGSRNAWVRKKRSLSCSETSLPPHTAVARVRFPGSIHPRTRQARANSGVWTWLVLLELKAEAAHPQGHKGPLPPGPQHPEHAGDLASPSFSGQGCITLGVMPSLLHWLLSWSVLTSSSVVTVGRSVTVCLYLLQPLSSFLRVANLPLAAGTRAADHRATNPELSETSVGGIGTSGLPSRVDCVTAAFRVRACVSGAGPPSTQSSAVTCCIPAVGLENPGGETALLCHDDEIHRAPQPPPSPPRDKGKTWVQA